MTTTNPRSYYIRPVRGLDSLLNTVALFIGKFSRIVDAGAFWHHDGHYFFEAWKDEESEGSTFGAYNLRLGYLELVVDYRISKAT